MLVLYAYIIMKPVIIRMPNKYLPDTLLLLKLISAISIGFIAMLMISCKSQTTSQNNPDPIDDYYVEFIDSLPDKDNPQFQVEFDTTIRVKNDNFRIYLDNLSNMDSSVLKIMKNGKLTQNDTFISWAILDVELIDFNLDGFEDVLIQNWGQFPSAYTYLFNSKTGTYEYIVNFENFTDVKQIHTQSLYYSYSRAGCADMNWYSYLIKIENNKAIPVALIEGNGCPPRDDSEKLNIQIFKISNGDENSKKLIKELPYDGTLRLYEDKWDYLEKYWIKNFRSFQ